MSAKKTTWWRRRLRKAGRERGMVEAGIAAAGGLLVVGAVVGNGVAAAAMDMSDGQTWLGSDDGSIVQVNPATGQPEYRLIIGGDGDAMEVTQNDGLLVVTNLETGVVTAIDLAGLVAGQSRQTDGETTILISNGMVMVVEMEPGFVQAVDPLTMRSLGSPYRAGEDLADAVIDGEGTVWLMTESGELRELDWVEDAGEFAVSLVRPVAGAGPDTRLVPHSTGVTIFAPDGGAVLQIGVGADYVQQVPALQGDVEAARTSPADLAPASTPDNGLVFVVSGRQLLTVDVATIGCAHPLRPAVLERRIYVPCGGEGRVIVLDENGARAPGPDILVPGGGDPELKVDDGRLFVHDPEDGRLVIVQPDGSTTVTDINGAEVPTDEVTQEDEPLPPISTGSTPTPPSDPTTTPPITIGPPLPPTDDPSTDSSTDSTEEPSNGSTDGPSQDPSDGPSQDPSNDPSGEPGDDPSDGTTTDAGEDDAELAPSGVTATLQGDESVAVTWTPATVTPEGYTIITSDGAVTRTVAADQTSATLTGLTCGTTVRVTVYGQHGERMVGSGADVDTAACVNPPEPAELTPRSVVAQRVEGDIVVGWTGSTIAPDRYIVTGMGLTRTVDGDETGVVFGDVECGEPIEFTVTAVHADAGEYSATSSSTTEACEPVTTDPADLRPRNVTLTRVSGNDYRLTWQAPVIAPDGFTITGNGVNQTVAAGITQFDVTIPCVATVQLTVTANHADGSTSPVQSNALSNTCTTTTTTTLTAPTNVAATLQGEDQIRVTWNASSPGAEEYVVIPSSGGTVSTTGTNATLTVVRGATYTFTVEARWQGQSATSAASNAVSVPAAPTVPGAPSFTSAYVQHQTGFITNSASWSAPDNGGSAITGYTLVWDGRVINLGPGQTSWSETVACNPCSMVIEQPDFDVSVSATNAVGTGPVAYTTPNAGGSPTIPAPENGAGVVDVSWTTPGLYEEEIPMHVTYSPTTAWAAYPGTCTLYSRAGTGGWNTRVISCNGSGTVATYPVRGGTPVSAYVVASGSISGATSATASEEAPPRNSWGYCDPSTGICTDPVGLADPDVEIDDLPWTPPLPPNPPVLVAGVGLLLGAGTLRTLRELRRRGLFEDPTTTDRSKDAH